MSNALAVLLGVGWLSVVGVVALVLLLRQPKRRKPVDELEAVDAALRNRLVDLEDKFEHYVKRENVRAQRGRAAAEQEVLPMTKADKKADLIRRWKEQQAQRGGLTRGAV